ncbi:hypothetical protein JZ751_012140 [Albula glossodonta]|uniref:Uncharacterized protein n=1 Tax=Albula glossodonta TaxID=121402 RepID=A0A8T2PRR6_9TELE|nr:hypothetical protein JZ751_012140 [Albula glossodonta]
MTSSSHKKHHFPCSTAPRSIIEAYFTRKLCHCSPPVIILQPQSHSRRMDDGPELGVCSCVSHMMEVSGGDLTMADPGIIKLCGENLMWG